MFNLTPMLARLAWYICAKDAISGTTALNTKSNVTSPTPDCAMSAFALSGSYV